MFWRSLLLLALAGLAGKASGQSCFMADDGFSRHGLLWVESNDRDTVSGRYEVEFHGPDIRRGTFTGAATPHGLTLRAEEMSSDGVQTREADVKRLADGSLQFYGMIFEPVACETVKAGLKG